MIPIERQIAEVRRELGMRRRVYPRFVAAGKLSQAQADDRIAILEEVRETLERLREPPAQADLLKGLPLNVTVAGGADPFDDIPF